MKPVVRDLGKVKLTIEGDYNPNIGYEDLCIVYDNHKIYISKKKVPIGIPVTNIDYWDYLGFADTSDLFHYEVYTTLDEITEPKANILYIIGPTDNSYDKYKAYIYDDTKEKPWINIAQSSSDIKIEDNETLKKLVVSLGDNKYVVDREEFDVPDVPIVTPSQEFVKTGTITFETSSVNAQVRYTIGEGEEPEDPTASTGEIGTTLILNQLESASTRVVFIKAITVKYDLVSDVVLRQYIIHSKVADVSFGIPSGNNYSESRTLSLSTSTNGAKIKYTLDGSDPKGSSGIEIENNSGSIIINTAGTTTIKAYAYKEDWVDSELTSTSVVARQIQQVLISADGGNYSKTRTLTMTCATSDVTIYYTTNGSTPTPNSMVYDSSNKPVLNESATVKAIAVRSEWTTSDTASTSIIVGKPAMHYGFAGETIDVDGIEALAGYKETNSPAGDYNSTTSIVSYLWICIDPNQTIRSVNSDGFEIPMNLNSPMSIGKYKCYRSDNAIAPGTMTYTIK